ncbi:hypothetical protein [Cytobacillus praedii]|uniref:hypothetical protein n=1 Tax=Cytobacillus praedii TaxID=1742358 RepID=UPI002E1D4DAE|nr:hypothetical protein [Cytobacillus praedii]
MRIFSLIQLSAAMIVFGIYFYFIEPLLNENMWLKLFIFVLVLLTLNYFSKMLEGRFKFLDKRIDNQLSVWIVFFIIFIPLFIGILN